MAIFLVQPDADGNCCECNERGEPCDTCGGPPPTDCYFQCRTKGGSASLIGFAEFTNPSTPPKSYRLLTLNGTQYTCVYDQPGCSDDFDFNSATTYAGTAQYNALNGNFTCDGTRQQSQGDVSCGVYSPFGPPTAQCSANLFGCNGGSLVVTRIQLTCVPRDCINGGGGGSSQVFGAMTATLSDEDTLSDAIARINLRDWSEWYDPFESRCGAAWQSEEDQTSITYIEAQWKVLLQDLLPNTTYYGSVKIYRRPYQDGSYVLYQTLSVYGTTDFSGNAEITGDVPNAEGYETYATTDCIFNP